MKRGAGGGGELPRKLTAVGTLGEPGAAYAVYEKNWVCAECRSENYARRQRCQRCRAKKVVMPDALVTTQAQQPEHTWREALDPASSKIYYYNAVSGATQWERPAEMGAAPHGACVGLERVRRRGNDHCVLTNTMCVATGWFGRGRAGDDNAKRYEEQNATFLARPARKQLEHMPSKNTHLEGAHEYNIWYDKYIGDHWANERGKEPAATRCVLATDAGRTKADVVSKANRYFCVHFARGMCARGPECNYYHRVPTMADEARIGMMHDCFGRERHATDRDDMSGVGNFTRNSRTLYVGGLKSGVEKPKQLEATVATHFDEWGEVESVNVIHRLSICFVRYRHRTSAEFAKEAMGNQALAHDEVLNIRWAFDDPNPVAKKAAQRSDHDAVVAMVQANGMSTQDAAFAYPTQYALPATTTANKRQRIDGDTVASYPDTSAQYSVDGGESEAADPYAQLIYADPNAVAGSETDIGSVEQQ